jgi:hypothetical protein
VSYRLLRMPFLNQDRKMHFRPRLCLRTISIAVLDVHAREDDHDDATSSCARKPRQEQSLLLTRKSLFSSLDSAH